MVGFWRSSQPVGWVERKRYPSVAVWKDDGFRGRAQAIMYYCKVLAAALARMRRYRAHHPHRSCGWLGQAKAAESLIAVPAFYIPAAQRFRRVGVVLAGNREFHSTPSFSTAANGTSEPLVTRPWLRACSVRPQIIPKSRQLAGSTDVISGSLIVSFVAA